MCPTHRLVSFLVHLPKLVTFLFSYMLLTYHPFFYTDCCDSSNLHVILPLHSCWTREVLNMRLFSNAMFGKAWDQSVIPRYILAQKNKVGLLENVNYFMHFVWALKSNINKLFLPCRLCSVTLKYYWPVDSPYTTSWRVIRQIIHVVMSPAKAKLFYASLAEKFQRSYLADSVKGDKYVFYNLLHFTQFANPNSWISNQCSFSFS